MRLLLVLGCAGGFAPLRPAVRRRLWCSGVDAGKTMGVDFGLKRTGVCVGSGWASRPLFVLENCGNLTAHAFAVVEAAVLEGCASFVVGLPLDRRGAESEQSGLAREFAQRLADVAALAVVGPERPVVRLWDERYSSREAEALVQFSPDMAELLDAVAACAFLDDFFAEEGAGAEVVGVSPAVQAAVDGRAATPRPRDAAPRATPPPRRGAKSRSMRYLE